jgi:hypothetical protein
MTHPGRVVRGIRRAFYANPGRELTTRELWSWTHPREVHCRDRFRRKNISRAIRAAAERTCVRAGRRWPHGVLWKLRDLGGGGAMLMDNSCRARKPAV